VLAFSCLITTQCSMSSAAGEGSWLRMGGGVAATGCFFAAQPARSRQNTSQAFRMHRFRSLWPACRWQSWLHQANFRLYWWAVDPCQTQEASQCDNNAIFQQSACPSAGKMKVLQHRSMFRSNCRSSIRREAKYIKSTILTHPAATAVHLHKAHGSFITRSIKTMVEITKSRTAIVRSHRSHHGLRCFTPAHCKSQHAGPAESGLVPVGAHYCSLSSAGQRMLPTSGAVSHASLNPRGPPWVRIRSARKESQILTVNSSEIL